MTAPDPEEDFDGFMDSLPNKVRSNILTHMRGETEEVEYDVDEVDIIAMQAMKAAIDGDAEAQHESMRKLSEIANRPIHRPRDSGPEA